MKDAVEYDYWLNGELLRCTASFEPGDTSVGINPGWLLTGVVRNPGKLLSQVFDPDEAEAAFGADTVRDMEDTAAAVAEGENEAAYDAAMDAKCDAMRDDPQPQYLYEDHRRDWKSDPDAEKKDS